MKNFSNISVKSLWKQTISEIDTRRLEYSHLENYIQDFYIELSENFHHFQDDKIEDLLYFVYWFWHLEQERKELERFHNNFKNKNIEWFKNQGFYLLNNIFNLLFFKDGNFVDENKRKDYLELLNKVMEEKDHETSYPKRLIIELTASCNLNCIMCGNANQKPGYDRKKSMSLVFFKNLSKELFDQVEWIRFNGFGETTILPNIKKYLDVLEYYKTSTNLELTTNLMRKNDSMWKQIVEMGCVLLISCDGSNKKLFEKIRKGSSWERFCSNLSLIKDLKNECGFEKQTLFIFTAQPENIQDLPEIISLAKEFDIYGVIVNMVNSPTSANWMNEEFTTINNIFNLAAKKAKYYSIDLRLPSFIGEKKVNCNNFVWKTSKNECFNPWEEVCIRYNGDLTVCNMFNPFCYGNISQDSFKNTWNSLSARFFRTLIKNAQYPPFCQKCYFLAEQEKS